MLGDEGDHERAGSSAGGPRRWWRAILFVASAGLAAALLRLAWAKPMVGVAMAAGALILGLVVLWRWWTHTRLVRMLRRGDVHRVIAHWSDAMDSIPHADTMAPLLTATAFAAFGRISDARRALEAAARGPAWDAALEHRLFLDALLSTFEGDADRARVQVAQLNALPSPSRRDLRDRVTGLREAISALVRAFEHCAAPGDLAKLEAASETSPLVHWAMRYGAAIVAIDAGDLTKARALIQGAPSWPEESAFRSFHHEIVGALG
jgi:hypothetical protein